ncbi:MAG: MrcB family domain-containing protein [Fusobacteriaceae bacterium]
MQSLKNGFNKILTQYLIEKKQNFSSNQLANFIRKGIIEILSEKSSIDSFQYILKGSCGQGAWADIPWIAILDKDITKSTQNGYYLVYLFDESMNRFYLSLNQGWTQYQNNFSKKEGILNINKVSQKLRNELRTLSPKYAALESIFLGGKGKWAPGYEKGHICGIEYNLNNLPDDKVFIDDLRNMLSIYLELKAIVGEQDFLKLINSFILDDEFFIQNEEFYEEKVEQSPVIEEIIEPKKKFSSRKNSLGESWPRDPKIAKTALNKANYLCELESSHISFISETTNKMYVEAHHLIPMNLQNDFENSLDVVGNIVSLCPNCHRKIHHSKSEDRSKMIEKLFLERKDLLKKYNLNISLEELQKKYK